jgi:prepilin-type N-terminal cleavage/methylation domain-containing protein
MNPAARTPSGRTTPVLAARALKPACLRDFSLKDSGLNDPALKDSGLTLPEALVTLALLGLLAALALPSGQAQLGRRRLELSTQLLLQGLERARSEAERRGEPCGLSLGNQGWRQPVAGDLPPCPLADAAGVAPQDGAGGELLSPDGSAVSLVHNFPGLLRVSANGLVLDGGTAVLSAPGTDLRRCLVMALPLGVVRLGRYTADPAAGINSTACVPDPSL